ncbi:MAG: hypothetical protein MUD01_13995 [Chloroflexaceae bacterium]|nr:hypothetical protein [Chloroflexaceae bacterium]
MLKQAVASELVEALNNTVETFPPLAYGQWLGNAQRRDYNDPTGLKIQNCDDAHFTR